MIPEFFRLHETTLWLIGTLSILAFVGTLIVIPILVIHIPVDYFNRGTQIRGLSRRNYSLIRLLGLVIKNLFGIIFVLAGIAMLVLPGQGFITLLIGIMLLDFPRKFALERRIVQQRTVLRAINWMRAKAHKPALQVPKRGRTTGGHTAFIL